MATTTNYGWTTPDDTALVKDGAAAIRTLGSSVDTTTKNLNPSTTLGDIEYRSSSANTNTRLAIGSTGDVLTVAGGVPTWAAPTGGMTLLSTTSLTGAAIINITSISAAYTNLHLVLLDVVFPSNPDEVSFRFNADGGSNYATTVGATSGASATTIRQLESSTVIYAGKAGTATSGRRKLRGYYTIPLYSSTVYGKSVQGSFFGVDNSSVVYGGYATGSWDSAAAINEINIYTNSGSNWTSGTALLYGVK